MDAKTKICIECGLPKSLDHFWNHPTGKYGKRSRCKKCLAAKNKEWDQQNPEKRQAINKRSRTPERVRKYSKKYSPSVSACRKELLGMDYGTATNKLRKALLFDLVQKLGRDICVRCSVKIESADDLSIEHIREWQDDPATLFWDLGNIGFSHRKCNVNRRVSEFRVRNMSTQ